MDGIAWEDRYKVGVDIIDNAHQKLFSLVHRLLVLSEDQANHRFACEEGIKFLKSYTLHHFAEEEAYMKKISYIGYEEHRQLHVQMREELPSYEQDLKNTDFSQESVQNFLGYCIGWLTGHIMTQDRDIVHRKEKAFDAPDRLVDVESFSSETVDVLKDIFGIQAEIVDMHYEVEQFGRGIYYCLFYRSEKGKRVLVSFLLNEQLVLHSASELPGIQFEKVDNVVLYATRQIARHLLRRISGHFHLQGVHRFEKDVIMDEKRFREQLNVANPYCSILFQTQYGPFAICVNK